MKTIKQIADEVGVSKQAIHKRITREPLHTSIQPYIQTIDGTKYIDIDGENIIKTAYSKNTQQPETNNVSNNVTTDKTSVHINVDSDVYTLLKETIETLREQLGVKDKQIEGLTEANKELIEVNKNLSDGIKNDRKNELAETIIKGRKQLAETTPETAETFLETTTKSPQKLGIFKRWFSGGIADG